MIRKLSFSSQPMPRNLALILNIEMQAVLVQSALTSVASAVTTRQRPATLATMVTIFQVRLVPRAMIPTALLVLTLPSVRRVLTAGRTLDPAVSPPARLFNTLNSRTMGLSSAPTVISPVLLATVEQPALRARQVIWTKVQASCVSTARLTRLPSERQSLLRTT